MGNEILYWKERHSLLLTYFITFPVFIRFVEGDSDSICDPLMCHTMSFHQGLLSNCKYNDQLWVPSQHGEWGVVLGGETHIATEVFHNLY